ncbi:MAG: M56 family metallopeptidase [Lachnospiraceae bacterium]|nr:M56 family metallopeptidase [Lachnospiraceae bacterium]
MINMLFLKIVEMSLTAGIVILVVMLVRLLIRRLPKSFAYALWIVVAFRLVIPGTADSGISIFNLFTVGRIDSVNSEITGGKTVGTVTDRSDIGGGNTADNSSGQAMREAVQNDAANMDIDAGTVKDAVSAAPDTDRAQYSDRNHDTTYYKTYFDNISRSGRQAATALIRNEIPMEMRSSRFVSMMTCVWITGILTLVSYTVIAHIRIRRKIQYSIRLCDNVYECDNIRSPFVIGIVSPRIYLPFRLSEPEQQCILAHERYHIRRKDYLIKSFAFLLTIVYWFHPLVWAAYHLMCIDMEMSCDEKIVSRFVVDLRKEYSRLLLAFAVNKRQFPAGPLAFGEENTMKRVRNILNYKKTAQWKLIGGVAVLVLTMAACATDASRDEAIAPVPDTAIEMKNGAENMTDVSVNDDAATVIDGEIAADKTDGTDTGSHDQEEQMRHSMEHHQALWAENSMFDLEFYSLDYADSDRIVFHISSGLFEYDLKSQMLTNSIDLKALNCQAVQTGGECEVAVYQNRDNELRVVIKPYPYSDAGSYVYDIENDDLFAYDTSLLDDFTLFDGFASKYDSTVSEAMRTWRAAENVLPLGEDSYGALYWGPGPDLVNLSYEAGEQKWQIFHKEQATLPKLSRQDDNFYQSFSMYSGREISQCLLDYEAFYNMHDYAGVCALSTGLEYSDELWKAFRERTDRLWGGTEVRHSEDEKEYLFEFVCSDESGEEEQKVYLNFKYIEGEGWRAVGLPAMQNDD